MKEWITKIIKVLLTCVLIKAITVEIMKILIIVIIIIDNSNL